jgi:hypothetical protein
MFEYYLTALLNLGRGDLASSALPDAPLRPERQGRRPGRGRRKPAPPPPNLSQALAPAETPLAAGPNQSTTWDSTTWDPCPCRRWGVVRADLHGCVALVMELFPELDRELDAWDAEHGWLYR